MNRLLTVNLRLTQAHQHLRIDRFRPRPLPLTRLVSNRRRALVSSEEVVLQKRKGERRSVRGRRYRTRTRTRLPSLPSFPSLPFLLLAKKVEAPITHVDLIRTPRGITSSISCTTRTVALGEVGEHSRWKFRESSSCSSFGLVHEGEDVVEGIRERHVVEIDLDEVELGFEGSGDFESGSTVVLVGSEGGRDEGLDGGLARASEGKREERREERVRIFVFVRRKKKEGRSRSPKQSKVNTRLTTISFPVNEFGNGILPLICSPLSTLSLNCTDTLLNNAGVKNLNTLASSSPSWDPSSKNPSSSGF